MADTNQLESFPWELFEKIIELLPTPDVLGVKQVRNDTGSTSMLRDWSVIWQPVSSPHHRPLGFLNDHRLAIKVKLSNYSVRPYLLLLGV